MTDIVKSAKTLKPMLEPRGVAVLGASDDPTKIGGVPHTVDEILDAILASSSELGSPGGPRP